MADIPKIRFKGFTEPWEQRKLEAVLSLLKDGTHGTHQDAEEGPYLLSAKNIKNGQIIIDDSSDRKISEDEFNQIHTKFTLENGDILLTIVGSIGESAILESAGKFTFQRSVAFLRPSEEMTSRFLKTEIESVQFQKELNDRKSQSAQPGVYLGDLSKIPIYITSKEEQKKIGKYFSHLDNLITLHQRKCDDTKELKKYMLQKMFPKNGEKFPEIRFKGFTEAWEQRKLSDVTACIKNGYTYKADGSRDHRYKITRIESISSGVINTEKLGSSDEINENYRLVDGDILFSHINSLPYIANTALYTADLGEIYHGMNLLNIRSRHEEIDSHFLLHLLKKESTRDWFRIIAKPAVNQASISTTEVGAFAFLIPRMEEQKKISSVLDNLDNLITLHQRKCDTLKELKKYMLQNMFPKKG